LISEGEIEALGLLMERAKVDPVRFCTFLKVPSLDQLPARRFRFAERALQDAIAKRPQQRPPAGPAEKAKGATSMTGGPAAGRASTGRPGELIDFDHQDEVP
jgi:hypothetical protein